MLTRNEAERLASAIHGLRPDWPLASLLTFIGKRKDRPLLDLTIELAWVAQLPDTKTPARADEDGPWKSAVRGAQPINTTAVLTHIDHSLDCAECFKPAEHLWHGNTGTEHDHDFIPGHAHARAVTERPKESTHADVG